MARIKKLKQDGATIYPVTIPSAVTDPATKRRISETATQSANGLMSATDKKKLDGLNIWTGTESAYNSLGKEAGKLYFITEE